MSQSGLTLLPTLVSSGPISPPISLISPARVTASERHVDQNLCRKRSSHWEINSGLLLQTPTPRASILYGTSASASCLLSLPQTPRGSVSFRRDFGTRG